jgi:hypothetical protein
VWLIEPRLFLGDYRSGEDALAGARRPVEPSGNLEPFAAVVSLCPMPLLSDDVIEGPSRPSTEWLHIAILDGGNGEAEFEAALGVILPFVHRRIRQGNVLIHCAAGMSRSVAAMAALLCESGVGVAEALHRISEAKARALHPFAGDPDDLIAPAWEFVACLERLYSDFDAPRTYGPFRDLTNGR